MRVVPGLVEGGKVKLYIEVRERPEGVPPADPAAAGIGASERLKNLGETVADVCKDLYQRAIVNLPVEAKPDEIAIEFGLTLGGEVTVPIIAAAKAEATITISAKWSKIGG